jgi:hypothetical protein
LLFLKTGSCYITQTGYYLCSPGWPQTCHSSTTASQMLGL